MENEQLEQGVQTKKLSITAKLLITATGGLGFGLSIVCASFVAPAFRRICLPYVPATTEQIQNVLSFLPKNSTAKLLDIGSGDGRIVIAAAKQGLKSDGVELNPWLIFYSRLSSLKNGLYKQTNFYQKDLWKFNIKSYDYIVIFGVEQMMKELEQKLLLEAASNAKIIACRYALPNFCPEETIEDGVNTVWLYVMNKNNNKNDVGLV